MFMIAYKMVTSSLYHMVCKFVFVSNLVGLVYLFFSRNIIEINRNERGCWDEVRIRAAMFEFKD